LKAGGAYVPLDPQYPQERLSFMARDAGVRVVLTQQRVREQAEGDVIEGVELEMVSVDAEWGRIERESAEAVERVASGENLAYVIYTSGSTGAPKSAMITHNALANFATAMVDIIGLSAEHRMLEFASLNFDASAVQIYPTLLSGAALVLHRDPAGLSNSELLRFCEEQNVTVIDLPAAFWRQWIDDLALHGVRLRPSFKVFMTGGESLPGEKLRLWAGLTEGHATFISSYGPTETTVSTTIFCTTNEQTANFNSGIMPIGRPIANARVYLLDRNLQPTPIGTVGELHVGGAGLSRGYLNHPQATAEKFIPDPLSAEPGGRLYKTGDLARYRPDGQLEFVGREDQQVKIRGFRVELGEIETVLGRHAEVKEAVVLALEGGGGKRLVAYFVPAPQTSVTVNELRDFVRERLPDHMIPSAFVALEAMPLNQNAKIDRKALPAPDMARGLSETFVAPRTPAEEIVAGIWAGVLGVPQVGVNDDFFELGGHSLLATQLVSRLRDVFQIELPLRSLFEAPTVAAITTLIETASRTPTPPILRAPRDEELPLSFAQQRLWFLDQFEPQGAVFNTPTAVVLKGALDVAALERSFEEILRRHEALRTTFPSVGGRPAQVINPAGPVNIPVTDLQHLPEVERRAESLRLTNEEARQPFDLAQGPLLRIKLLRMDEEEHLLLMTMHHIIFDGWSLGVLVEEIAALYEAHLTGRPPQLPELPIQYADYAYWQQQTVRGEMLEEQLSYWKQELANLPSSLDLPTDRPRPQVQTFRGARHTFALSAALTEELLALSRREGATLFMTAFAAFVALLHRYTGQEDIVVGADIANRTRLETERLIGCFFNHLVLRVDVSGEPTFRELVRHVRSVTLGAYAHQDLPFDMLVRALQPERSTNRSPLFQVLFVYQNAPMGSIDLPGLTLTPLDVDNGVAKFDLTIFMSVEGERLAASLEYNSDLFDAATILQMTRNFEALLEGFVQNPDGELHRIAMSGDEQKPELVYAFNDALE
jgi:amino acid adenylation domain-containing protein